MEPQHVLAGRYALISHLARGGMADVYVAEDRRLGRRVAVKVLHGQLARSEAFVERFRREAQAAAGLQHPNVVGIHDWGRDEEQDLYFMVMELVRGRNLRQVLKSEGTLLPQRVAEIGSDVASALSAAHRAGVVHRDIKPANVLLTGDGTVKVTDFGIARAWDDSEQLTRTGAVIGTATYFSPEQAQGLPADARSDVYSLGVVMYELLTGRPPFTGESPVAVAYQHVREEVPLPTSLNPRIPLELEDIVMRALAKDPDRRYQTADDMRDDLERFLAGIPPVATEETEAATRMVAAAPIPVAADAASTNPGGPPPPGGRAPRPDYSAETYGEPTRIGTSTWIIGVMAATALVGLALILLIRILSSGDETTTVEIPSVVGMTVEDATTTLEDLGLEVSQSQVPSADVPVGLVAGTEPPEGTMVDPGSTAVLLISTGPSSVEVPNLLDLTLDQARSLLLSSGLSLGDIDFEVSAVVEPDTVLGQDPMPGEVVSAGTEIDIIVSAGTDTIEMPDVVGKSEADALFTLAQAGFQSDQIVVEEQASSEVLEGFVVESIPSAGQPVASNGTITLIVSSGAPVVVPDVRGMEPDEAEAELEELGLVAQFGDVVELPFGDPNDGLVVEQDPAEGTELEEGDVVTLRVGTSTEPVEVPDLIDFDSPLTLNEARSVIEGLGLVMVQGPNVEVEYGSDFEGHVAEQSPPPATEVAEGSTVTVHLGEGPEPATVPDVVGDSMTNTEAQAQQLLQAARLTFVKGSNIPVDYGDPKHGFACSQSLPAGQQVEPFSDVTVRFCVQQNPRVPDLISPPYYTKLEAEDEIELVDLIPVHDDTWTCDPGGTPGMAEGEVVKQWPDPNTSVAVDSEVKFYLYEIGAGACPTDEPELP